jgi:hypothetical protein
MSRNSRTIPNLRPASHAPMLAALLRCLSALAFVATAAAAGPPPPLGTWSEPKFGATGGLVAPLPPPLLTGQTLGPPVRTTPLGKPCIELFGAAQPLASNKRVFYHLVHASNNAASASCSRFAITNRDVQQPGGPRLRSHGSNARHHARDVGVPVRVSRAGRSSARRRLGLTTHRARILASCRRNARPQREEAQ